MAPIRLCSIPDCGKPRWRREYCSGHYQRMMKHGDPLAGGTSQGICMKWLEDHSSHVGDECLIWPFGTFGNGYAKVYDPSDRKTKSATNIMCRRAHGEPPSDKHEGCHSCAGGPKACINPGHLRWGTKSENAADRLLDGTANRGIRHGIAKLDDNDVRTIREMAKSQSQTFVGSHFGVCQQTVSDIVTRRNWAWLPD